MKTINKILVCLDLSEYSEDTLECAVTIAGNTHAEIHIINVINSRDIRTFNAISPSYSVPIDESKFIQQTTEKRNMEIKTLISEKFSDVQLPMSIQITMGTPFEEIITTAEKENVDMIVMGSKGKGNLARTLFGSQAEKVFRHSPIPVLSVRRRPHKRQPS